MYLSETHANKWAPVLDHPELPKIADPYRRAVTALVLENQERALREEAMAYGNLWEAPVNAVGGGMSPVVGGEGGIKGFDPILIGLVRRAMPNLMAYDICGVQPMTGPTGLIFAMRSKYSTQGGTEALFNEADTDFSSGSNTAFGLHDNNTPFGGAANASLAITQQFVLANTGGAANTRHGEDFGGAAPFAMGEMAFSIDRVSVVAGTRALKAEYTLELAQDLKAIHGLDAEAELSNILSTEILAEINREVVRKIYATAVVGYLGSAGSVLATTSNTFNLAANSADTTGRWAVERFKGLLFAIERASNQIAKDTRRGKGNIIICSTDVASALAMTGLLDYQSGLTNNTNLTVDDTGNTFAGTLFGRVKVYVDPYSVQGQDFVVVGYKGSNAYDAGLFYCPYVPLQMMRAIDPNTFQPKIGFKTRYGLVANPFATSAGNGTLTDNTNLYYRRFRVSNMIA
jgi:hypothetical protein